MVHTRIKICGITRPEDAVVAAACGADAIGLVFYAGSPRAVTLEQARRIADSIPPFVCTVALFVNELADTVARTIAQVPVDLIQFHGDETAEFCGQFGRPWIKALRVRPELDLLRACDDYRSARGILLDSWQDGVPGGTGKTFDWRLAPESMPLPWVLAGGLDQDNVSQAVIRLRPAAVDVSGGVEHAPGIKDERKISQFIAAVRNADTTLNGMKDDQ